MPRKKTQKADGREQLGSGKTPVKRHATPNQIRKKEFSHLQSIRLKPEDIALWRQVAEEKCITFSELIRSFATVYFAVTDLQPGEQPAIVSGDRIVKRFRLQ